MAVKSTFSGKFYFYENINGKEKTIEKSFTDPKKYSEFMLGLSAPKPKALPKKKSVKSVKTAKKVKKAKKK